jgi:anaerobic magnesium-protoporphyrin IX monomethyl ester cyclase
MVGLRKVDVLLVYLPVAYGLGKAYGLPPNGIYSLGAILKANGYSVRVLDASIKGLSFEETLSAIHDCQPSLVGISALTPHLPSMSRLVATLNQQGFEGRIICGGPHFNNTREEFMLTNNVSYIMYGEAENAFVEFTRRFLAKESMEGQPNLIWRPDGGEIVTNPALPVIEDLDTLPFADLSLGDPGDYETMYGSSGRITGLLASRGCPYLCTFCDVFSVWGRKMRFRSASSVMDEIEYNIRNFGITEFVFKDSTFTLNYKWLDSLLDEMEKRKLPITWICNTRVDRVTLDLLKRMKRLGLTTISYGVESGSQEILDSLKKKITIAQIEEAFRMTASVGLAASAYFMVGNPGESLATAQQSLDLALRLPATFVDVSVTVAYPGTELYDVAVQKGYLKDPKWYLQDGDMGGTFLTGEAEANPGNLYLPDFPPESQYAFARKFWRKVYLRPITVYRILIQHGSPKLFMRVVSFLPKFIAYVFSKPRKQYSNETHNSKGEHLPVRP